MSPPPPAAELDASEAFGAAAAPSPARRIPLPLPTTDDASIAIGLVVVSTAFFAAGDSFAKLMTATLPAIEVAWLRYAVFAAVMVPVALMMGGLKALAPRSPGMQVLRGAAVTGSAAFFIMGLSHLGVAQATAINFVSPIFITALSIPILGERVGLQRWAAAALGFVGVLMVVQPGGSSFTLAALLPMAAALSWALGAVFTRKMSAERPEVTLAWTAAVGLAILSALVPFEWRAPNAHELWLALATGLCSTAGHGLLVLAFRRASASALAPFSYVQILFAAVMGYAVFSTVPGPWTVAGGAVIAASGLWSATRERAATRRARLEAMG